MDIPRRRFTHRMPGFHDIIPRTPQGEEMIYTDMDLHQRITVKGYLSDARHTPADMVGMKRTEFEQILELIASISGAIGACEHMMYKIQAPNE